MEQVKEKTAADIFCESFAKLQRHPMDKELSELMIRLTFGNLNIPEKEKPFLFNVIEKRVNSCQTFSIKEQKLILFLCAITSVPGVAVAYLTFLEYWCKKNNVKVLTFDIFCIRVFPMGFLAHQDVINLLDNLKYSKEVDNTKE